MKTHIYIVAVTARSCQRVAKNQNASAGFRQSEFADAVSPLSGDDVLTAGDDIVLVKLPPEPGPTGREGGGFLSGFQASSILIHAH